MTLQWKMIPLLFAVCAATIGHDVHGQPVAPNTLSVGLKGYSPVSYFQTSGPRLGNLAYQATHDDVTYLFASQAELKQFNADPDRYAPAYAGWCAYGMAVEGQFDADPTNYQIVNGKLHVFLKNDEIDTRQLWNQGHAAELCHKADAYWHQINHPNSRAYLHSQNVWADGIALDGYSPVSYFTQGQAEKGSPRFAIEHDGVTYHLASEKQVEQFKADPGRYVPAFGGWCAFGMSVQDKFPVDPTAFKIVDGKLLVFLRNEQIDASSLWNQGDPREHFKKAQAHWKKVSG